MSHEQSHVPHLPARSTRLAMLAALAVVLLHAAGVWGHPSLWWGDNGRWLHELDRVAHGAVFYRDIYWAFPPLAMWLLGGLTRIIGSDLIQVWTLTTLVAVGIALAYGAVVARLVPGRLAALVAATGMVLGAAYSQQASAPLALGMYTPAVPVAALCLMLQLVAFLRDWERPVARRRDRDRRPRRAGVPREARRLVRLRLAHARRRCLHRAGDEKGAPRAYSRPVGASPSLRGSASRSWRRSMASGRCATSSPASATSPNSQG